MLFVIRLSSNRRTVLIWFTILGIALAFWLHRAIGSFVLGCLVLYGALVGFDHAGGWVDRTIGDRSHVIETVTRIGDDRFRIHIENHSTKTIRNAHVHCLSDVSETFSDIFPRASYDTTVTVPGKPLYECKLRYSMVRTYGADIRAQQRRAMLQPIVFQEARSEGEDHPAGPPPPFPIVKPSSAPLRPAQSGLRIVETIFANYDDGSYRIVVTVLNTRNETWVGAVHVMCRVDTERGGSTTVEWTAFAPGQRIRKGEMNTGSFDYRYGENLMESGMCVLN